MTESNPKIKTRWQAFAVHFLISLVLFLTIAGIITFNWYPDGYFWLGGLKAVGLIAGVDLVLGPMLTLIVYDIKKKSLPLDLTVIGIVQFSALAFGIWTVHQARPILQIQSYDKVYALTQEEIEQFGISMEAINVVFEEAPIKFYLDLPQNAEAIEQIELINSFTEGKHIISRDDLYRSYPYGSLSPNIGSSCFEATLIYLGQEHRVCVRKQDGSFSTRGMVDETLLN